MIDKGIEFTEKRLRTIKKKIESIYTDAQKEIEAKTENFWERHKAKDKNLREKLEKNEITKEDYAAWIRGQVFQGKMWEAKLNQIESVLANSNEAAISILNGERINVFAENANWQLYQIDNQAGFNFGFGFYDTNSVNRLLLDNPDLLPAKKLNIPKDKIWNKGNITRQITQGIIQGESLDKIAKRLQAVTDMNRNHALTNARTMMTGAQNAGRQEAFKRAESMGIQLKKEWIATLDGHTRISHRKLDGQLVDQDKPFKIYGYEIMYPGDPHARPELVYNCRCTVAAKILDVPKPKKTKRRNNITGKAIKDLTYREWKAMQNENQA